MLYCHPLRSWLVWDDARYAPDQDAEVERLAKNSVRKFAHTALSIENDKDRSAAVSFAVASERDHAIKALLGRAAAEVPVSIDDLDTDLFAVNTLTGTVDLRTGQLRPHRRDDLITKLAPVLYDPMAECSRWLRFLDEVFNEDADVIEFIQRAAGYALTGDGREECLLLLYGVGRNGKGTFLKTLQAALGDYAYTCDFSTFVSARNDRSPRDDIANMRGKRFVVSQEPSEGAVLAESTIKWLTGNDRVRARNKNHSSRMMGCGAQRPASE